MSELEPCVTNPPKKTTKKKIKIILLCIMLLLITGIGGFYIYMKYIWPSTVDGFTLFCLGVRAEEHNKDYDGAFEWYKLGAEKQNMFAQWALATCYNDGKGVKKDPIEAIKWFTKAANQGHPDALCQLANIYLHGINVEKNPQEAVKWLHKAAEQKNQWAQYNLGVCYAQGLGCSQDSTQAVHWYRKAAEQGYAPAQHNLGVYYHYGEGVEKDYTQAEKWYQKAAEQGEVKAQKQLKLLKQTIANEKKFKTSTTTSTDLTKKQAILNTLQTARRINVCLAGIRNAIAANNYASVSNHIRDLSNVKKFDLDKCPEDFKSCAENFLQTQISALKTFKDDIEKLQRAQNMDDPRLKLAAVLFVLNNLAQNSNRFSNQITMYYYEMLECAGLHGVDTSNFK